ncbi:MULTISPECIES: nitrilase-related carbon-nitrogen hydrolase [unclassified Streptomyces]|uniref:nitrilase-related carbon-nitrogen hydrolase n=1 Tax=unclassified Streptomyces TaxID=2593676 RepID=UPI0024756516|nr:MULTISPECIES: nitrilase-related carbon-nitrogen hydrolase [unclassified Streptomyces]MDH6451812.1 putative amidohydrolase [Streptomyces sp. SAI-119]MDH6497631.1 putative amidohydrolase [Streptomyces sp. SAI-149]
MRASVLQIAVRPDEPADERRARVGDLVRRQDASDLVVLPELWTVGAFAFDAFHEHAESLDGPTAREMSAAAAQARVWLHAGSVVERGPAGELYNTSLLFGPDGRLRRTYRKIHRFGFDRGEATLLARGVETVTAVLDGDATTGPATGPTANPAPGPTPGPVTGPTPGPTTGPTPGPTTGPTPGPTTGPTPGPATGPTRGPATGPTAGPATGSAAGSTAGPAAGPTAGPAVGLTVGFATCYDLRFPEQFRLLVDAGAELFLVPAGWPAARRAHWSLLARARAVESQAYVLACGTAGTHAGVEQAGHSVVVDPWGEVVAEAGTDEETLVVDLDPALVAKTRAEFPALRDRVLGVPAPR